MWKFATFVILIGLGLKLFWKEKVEKIEIIHHSSVSCKDCNENKCCEFQNLYYFPTKRSFVFLLTEESKLYGINDVNDLYALPSSSVLNHTDLYLPIVVSRAVMLWQSFQHTTSAPVFVMHRFKPDNIMHIFHDDLLPLFARYEALCVHDFNSCMEQSKLLFIDPHAGKPDPYISWYKLLSNEVLQIDEPTVLARVITGLPRVTVGFQYGFTIPHGPIPLHKYTTGIFKRFSTHIRHKLKINNTISAANTRHVLYIQRNATRRILNEKKLYKLISKSYEENNLKMELIRLNLLHKMEISKIITQISDADLIIGMHGATMYLSALFSKKDSVLVEIYPYGIQSKFVSPIQSIAHLSDCWFTYKVWESKVEGKASLVNSDPLQGGIGHLDKKEQAVIKKTVPVPAVLCCHDPAYLYRMFQDTNVDPEIKGVISDAIKNVEMKKRSSLNQFESITLLPGPVTNLKCRFYKDTSHTAIVWEAPANMLDFTEIVYDISYFNQNDELKNINFKVESLKIPHRVTQLWIKACCNHICGNDMYFQCH